MAALSSVLGLTLCFPRTQKWLSGELPAWGLLHPWEGRFCDKGG